MNNWLKAGLCAFSAIIIYFVGFEAMQLYSWVFSFFLILVACAIVLGADKVNWGLLFKKDKTVLSLDEWTPKAVAAVKKNSPHDFRDGTRFEAEVLGKGAGLLWAYPQSAEHRRCAFGDMYKDSPNPIISPLAPLKWHLHTAFCSSKFDVAELYLRGYRDVPGLLKNKTLKQREVVST